jgi:1,4-dihydroxy-2-naphthoate octaprenyltransferase
MAARPKTLPAAAAPVIVGSAAAYSVGHFQLLPALAALLAALLLQIGANFSNDVFDFHRGADTPHRLGPLRVAQAGLLTPTQIYKGMIVVFGLAAVLGIYLAWVGGWPIVLVGLAAISAAIAYTGGPFPLGYIGLGDLAVFIFFGPAAVWGTCYVQVHRLDTLAVWSAIPVGLLITALLVVNNLRDIETDRAVGKHTLAVRLGVRGTRLEYLVCLSVAYAIPIGLVASRIASPWVFMTWLSLPLAFSLLRRVWQETGRSLNQDLAGTARLSLVYALLYALGLIIASL